MASFGLIEENMELSHIHSAVIHYEKEFTKSFELSNTMKIFTEI